MASPPSITPPATESGRRFASLLEKLGVTHLVTVPDNTSAPILASLMARQDRDSGEGKGRIRAILATREGEAMGLAAGLWLGGGLPVVLIQNTGLLEAGDGLRGTLARMGAPVVLLITCRGYEKARKAGRDPSRTVVDRDALVREDLDSVAFMTEPTLKAWGIPFLRLADPLDTAPVEGAFRRAREEGRPVALLLDTSFHQDLPC